MNFAREGLLVNREQLEPIFGQHWDDVLPDFENIRLGFDWDTYGVLEHMGSVLFVVAREADHIAGYQLCIMRPHIHSKETMVATTTFFYLLPEYRKGWNAVEMFRTTEKLLKDMGIENIYLGSKSCRSIAPILQHLGYYPVETMYAKVLA